MTDVLRIGLIGLGEWPRNAYVPVLQELAGVQVCAVAAPSAATRQLAQGLFGSGLRVYADYRDLLGDPSVEAVTLALPNTIHLEATRAALASGKHVFYEPPLAHNETDLRQALATMGGSDRVIQADLELRYLPVVEAACRLLARGSVGDPLMAAIRLWCNWGYGGGQWKPHPESEGFFPWLGCWYLDVLDCVFAVAPLRASVVGGRAANRRLMDHGWAALEYPEGRIGQFEFNLVAVQGLDIRLNVLGTHGELAADLCSGLLRWRGEDGVWQEASHPASQPAHGFVGMRECLAAFCEAARSGARPRADVHVARRVHASMLACARSEAQEASVRVELLD